MAAPVTHHASAQRTVPVVLLSDIHFDPFHDPSKVAGLRSAPIEQWNAILAAPAAASDAADFVALQRTCNARGVDTDYTLLHASLAAAHTRQPAPLFVTVSGDLMAHAFDCRFHHLATSGTDADYSAFAAKTVAFVALSLREAFPGTPVYMALGNNDSGCADYRETPGSPYLQSTAESLAAGLPAAERSAVQASAAQEGDYSASLPAPMQDTRLIVLQDIFESRRYKGCAAAADAAAAADQIAWLRAQLTEARDRHQRVWVMAHIPPGVDVYTTVRSGRDVCAGQPPEMFLNSDELTETLVAFAPTVRLVVLAHTHMDEVRLLHAGQLGPSSGRRAAIPAGAIPAKLVPSISPVNGNNPAFTVAQVNPRTSTLVDYEVYAADNQTGVGTHWAEEYRYSTTYHQPDFSAASVSRLLGGMRDDKTAAETATHDYAHWFWVGDSGLHALALRVIWPAYSCAIVQSNEAGYRRCACPAGPAAEPATVEPAPGGNSGPLP